MWVRGRVWTRKLGNRGKRIHGKTLLKPSRMMMGVRGEKKTVGAVVVNTSLEGGKVVSRK